MCGVVRQWSFGLEVVVMMMCVDERIRFLLRTALRAEGEGDLRVAELFRRMADELRPLGRTLASVVDLLEEGRSE